MKLSEMTVSKKLSKLFQNFFYLNFSYLVFYDDDTEQLLTTKKSCWLLLLDTVIGKMEDKPAIDYLDYMEIYNEHSAICQQIESCGRNIYGNNLKGNAETQK